MVYCKIFRSAAKYDQFYRVRRTIRGARHNNSQAVLKLQIGKTLIVEDFKTQGEDSSKQSQEQRQHTSWRSWSSQMVVAVSSWFSMSSREGAAGAAGWGGPEPTQTDM